MSWFELGAEVGLDVVSDTEVEEEEEEEIKASKEDKEVATIFKRSQGSNREKHDKFKRGTVHWLQCTVQCIDLMS